MDCADHKSLFRDFEASPDRELMQIYFTVQDSELKVRGSGFLDFGIVKGVGIQDHPSRFALATNPWFDLGLIKFWKHRCINEHRQSCGNPWMIRQIKPAWLINTQRRCLVPGNEGGAYICLSYRWGESPAYRTTKAALPDLQKPGSLDRTDIKAQLPPVVSQAMQLEEAMDERFLWVDTLCIPQDDEDLKVAEMDRMGEIYGSSLLTIIAAEGDGDHGIPGLPGAAPRISNQDMFKFAHHTLIQIPISEYMEKTHGTAYEKRGWTYQEYKMSARKLIFAGNRVHWDCRPHLASLNDDFSRVSVDNSGVDTRIELAAICRRTWDGSSRFMDGVGDAVPKAAKSEEEEGNNEYLAYWDIEELVYRDYYAVLRSVRHPRKHDRQMRRPAVRRARRVVAPSQVLEVRVPREEIIPRQLDGSEKGGRRDEGLAWAAGVVQSINGTAGPGFISRPRVAPAELEALHDLIAAGTVDGPDGGALAHALQHHFHVAVPVPPLELGLKPLHQRGQVRDAPLPVAVDGVVRADEIGCAEAGPVGQELPDWMLRLFWAVATRALLDEIAAP
ncbi:hypothetical protein PG988_015471 [Apiospora saccharicola]